MAWLCSTLSRTAANTFPATELAASEDPQGAGDPESSDPSPSTAPASLPTSLVKKIMTMDSDVSRVSAEGLRAVGAATEAFLGLLAAGALARAAGDKRKNFRFGDVLALALKDRRLIDMGLAEVLQQDPQFREVCSLRWMPGQKLEGVGVSNLHPIWAHMDRPLTPRHARQWTPRPSPNLPEQQLWGTSRTWA